MEQIILQFGANTDELAAVATELRKLGQITEEQEKAILDLSKKSTDAHKQQAQAIKQETSELGKLNQNLKQTTQTLSGGAIKASTAQMKEFAKGLQQGINEGLKEFGINLDNTGKKSVSLVGQLRALKQQLAGLDEGSEEFQKVAIEAAQLEDKIGDVGERVRVLASDTFPFDAMIDGVRGITAAFTVAQSASALFGEENEDLQKALLKVQAASGLLAGVQELANQATGQGAAKLAILSGAQSLYATIVGTSTGALKAFRIALAATGIGLAIAGIATLIANWDKIKASITGVSKEQSNLNKARMEGLKTYADEATRADLLIKKYGDVNTTTTERRDILKQLNEISPSYFKNLDTEKTKVEDLEKAYNNFVQALIAKGTIEELTKQASAVRVQILSVEQELKDGTTGLQGFLGKIPFLATYFNPAISAAEKLSSLNKEIATITDQIKEQGREMEKLGGDPLKTLEAVEKKVEDIITFDPNKKNEIREIIKDAFDIKGELPPIDIELKPRLDLSGIQLEIPESEQQRFGEKLSAIFSRDEVKAAAISSAQEIFDAVFEISNANREREFEAELASIDRKRQAEVDAIEKRVEFGVLTEEQARVRMEAIEAKYRERERALKAQQFQAQKQASLSQAFINGAVALTKTYAEYGFTPAGIAAAFAQAISTTAQIAVIAAQRPPAFKHGKVDIDGPGTSTSDSIPALISRGESVINARATQLYKPELELMNKLQWEPPDLTVRNYDKLFFKPDPEEERVLLAKALAKELRQVPSPKTNVIVDKNGIVSIVDAAGNSRTYYGSRYSSE